MSKPRRNRSQMPQVKPNRVNRGATTTQTDADSLTQGFPTPGSIANAPANAPADPESQASKHADEGWMNDARFGPPEDY